MPFRALWIFFATPQSRFGLAGLVVIVLPAIWFGPWLPLHDLIAFVGLDTYPAKLSFGPFHYAVFQFTYVLHLAVSRFMSGLGIGAPAQVVLFYVVQGVVLFVVLWRLIEKLVPNPWLGSVAIVLGTLSFWEGQFLWGGPLPCSLAATLLAVAMFLTLRETEGGPLRQGVAVPALSIVSLFSHPFALPFAMVLTGFRFVLVPGRRRQCLGTAAALLALGAVIRADSPDPDNVSGGLLHALLAVNPSQLVGRLTDLFSMDAWVVRHLFGDTPWLLHGYLIGLGAIHLTGFVVSPWVAWRAKDEPGIRALAILDSVVATMYFLSPSLVEILPWWPQRILAFYSPFTFAAGIVGPAFLLRSLVGNGFRWRWLRVERATWMVPVALLAVMVAVQVPILSLSAEIKRSYNQVRDEILKTNLSNVFVVVSDLQRVQPIYLRCVSFLLFSDRQLVDRNLRFFTEWHIQARHPTRLTESWFELGRPQYVAAFRSEAGLMHVKLTEVARSEVAVPTGNNALQNVEMALWARNRADELNRSLYHRESLAHYRAALRLDPNNVEVLNNLGVALLQSAQRGEALEMFQSAIKLRPDFPDALSNLGYLMLQTEHRNEAVGYFRAALRINPEYTAAKEGLRQALAPK